MENTLGNKEEVSTQRQKEESSGNGASVSVRVLHWEPGGRAPLLEP